MVTDRKIMIPGPDHPIAIEPSSSRVRIRFGDRLIADTTSALELREADYAPVLYIPRADADLEQLEASDHSTYCPFKGDCSYFSIAGGEAQGLNAAWTYEAPFEVVRAIAGHLAFYPDRVTIEKLG